MESSRDTKPLSKQTVPIRCSSHHSPFPPRPPLPRRRPAPIPLLADVHPRGGAVGLAEGAAHAAREAVGTGAGPFASSAPREGRREETGGPGGAPKAPRRSGASSGSKAVNGEALRGEELCSRPQGGWLGDGVKLAPGAACGQSGGESAGCLLHDSWSEVMVRAFSLLHTRQVDVRDCSPSVYN